MHSAFLHNMQLKLFIASAGSVEIIYLEKLIYCKISVAAIRPPFLFTLQFPLENRQ